VGNLEKRLEALEVRKSPEPFRSSEARVRMKTVLDEIAAARREGKAPHEEAAAVMEAMEQRRRSRES
jgi:hypothetical protein